MTTTAHLLVLEPLGRTEDRPQDYADLRALARIADQEDLAAARQAARLVAERRSARGRPLLEELENLRSGGSGATR